MLLVAPLALILQTTPTVPTSTPPDGVNPAVWALLVGIALVAVELTRRYINSRIDAKVASESARLVLETKKVETDSNIRMEQIKSETVQQQNDAEGMRLLSASIDSMAKAVSSAYLSLANDRQQAATERQEFRMTLDGNTNELKRHAEELSKLRTAVEKLANNATDILEQIKAIQDRIGGDKDDPPLTKLVSEAAEAAKQAASALAKAEQEVKPPAVTNQVTINTPPAPPAPPAPDDLPSASKLTPGVPSS